jgi:hypothetical protein
MAARWDRCAGSGGNSGSLGFAPSARAQRELTRLLHLLDRGQDPFPEKVSVAEYVLDRWLPHRHAAGMPRPGTIRTYRQLMPDHVLPRLSRLEVAKVQPPCSGRA